MIGHRGARSRFPENTIEGFQAALAAGVGHFEIDVALTRDGVPVLSHDPCLSSDLTRQRGAWIAGSVAINRLDAAELGQFDVGRARPGSRTARRFACQVPVDGAGIPALEDALRLPGRARWTIELKTYPNRPWLTAHPHAMAQAVAAAVDRAGAAGRVTIQSFDWRGPRHLRRVRPDLAYAWLTVRTTRAWRGGQASLPDSVTAEGGGTWSPHFRELDQRRLDRAKRAGLRVVPWTVNHPVDILRLASWGVDGIITDDPTAAYAALAGSGSRPGAPARSPHPARR